MGLWTTYSNGGFPVHGKVLELDDLQGSFQPKIFYDSIIFDCRSIHSMKYSHSTTGTCTTAHISHCSSVCCRLALFTSLSPALFPHCLGTGLCPITILICAQKCHWPLFQLRNIVMGEGGWEEGAALLVGWWTQHSSLTKSPLPCDFCPFFRPSWFFFFFLLY